MNDKKNFPSGQDKVWKAFTKATFYACIIVAVTLALLAYFLVG